MKTVEYFDKDYDVEDWVEYMGMDRDGIIIGFDTSPIKVSSGWNYTSRGVIIEELDISDRHTIEFDNPMFFTEHGAWGDTLRKVEVKKYSIEVGDVLYYVNEHSKHYKLVEVAKVGRVLAYTTEGYKLSVDRFKEKGYASVDTTHASYGCVYFSESFYNEHKEKEGLVIRLRRLCNMVSSLRMKDNITCDKLKNCIETLEEIIL